MNNKKIYWNEGVFWNWNEMLLLGCMKIKDLFASLHLLLLLSPFVLYVPFHYPLKSSENVHIL